MAKTKNISVSLVTDNKAAAVDRYKNTKMVGCEATILEGAEAEKYGAKFVVFSKGPVAKLKKAIILSDEAWFELSHG